MDEIRRAKLLDEIRTYLLYIGYDATVDKDFLSFVLDYWLDYIVVQTNNSVIDPRCDTAIVEKVAAEFLMRKKNMGLLEGFDYDRGVKAITEGDTKVEYLTGDDAQTSESRFNKCLNEMIRGFDKKVISPFRKLRW